MYPYTGIADDFRASNREDLYFTVSVYDDDTGMPIDMSGCTLANPAQPFTGSFWLVTGLSVPSGFSSGFSQGFGSIPVSETTLTIPVYPIGNQNSAVTLTIQEGLTIAAGTQVTIQDPTGLNTMTGIVLSYASSTGILVVQVGWIFDFEIRRRRYHGFNDGYGPFYDIGTYPDSINEGAIIIATLGNGLMLIDVGYLQVRIPECMMQRLRNATYGMGCVGTDGYDTRQLLDSPLHVIGGEVRRNPFSQVPQSNAAWEATF